MASRLGSVLLKHLLTCLLFVALVAAVSLGGAGFAGAGGAAASSSPQSPTVALRSLDMAGGLPVEDEAAVRRAAAGFGPAAPPQGSSVTAGGRPPAGQLSGPGIPGGGHVLDPGMRFTMLGLICDVPGTPHPVSLWLRTSPDARSWSRWFMAPLELAAEEGERTRAFTEPLWTGAARFAQVRAVAGGGGANVRLTGVRLVALAPEIGVDPAGPAGSDAGAGRAAAAGLRPALPVRPEGMTAASARTISAKAPLIVTRRQWGADESLRGAGPDYARVRMVFVHHTAGGNDYTADQAAAVVRGIYAYHTRALGWSDIGYNFLVDRFGVVYEGRAGGVRRGVVGAQVLGFNSGSCGVSMMGNFAGDAPPAEALASLQRLLAWKLKVHHLNPRGTATMRCTASAKFAAGARVKLPVIAGHRQVNFTECPGNILYPLLPAVRLEAAGRPQPPVIALVKAAPGRFSPNGDDVLDTALVRVSLTKTASWRVELRDARGKTLGHYTGRGSTASVRWSGVAPGGHAYPDGAYTAAVSASSPLGAAAPRKVKLTVDTAPPVITDVAVETRRFSPNGDAWGETARVRFQPAETCSARVSVLDDQGKVVRRLDDWRGRTATVHSAAWDGKLASGRAAAEGAYRLLVECRDAAGNTSRRSADIVLDRTLGFLAATPSTFSPNGDGASDTVALAFKLTRTAAVKVDVKVGGKTVRTLGLGSLDAGSHSVRWDGATAAGVTQTSCRPTFTVSATSVLGTSSATGRLMLDVDPPALTAPPELTVAAGKSARLACTVADLFGDQVEVSYAISDAAGVTVAAASLGWAPVGAVSWMWKPSGPGVYTVSYSAVDRGGNREQAPAVTLLTVQGPQTTKRSPDG